jgi:hypothetical protein
MAGLMVKPGLLWTDSAGLEESASAEIWSRGAWSTDLIGTKSVGGLGIVKDIGAFDIGVYAVSPWDRWEPEIGLGIGLGF